MIKVNDISVGDAALTDHWADHDTRWHRTDIRRDDTNKKSAGLICLMKGINGVVRTR